MSKQKTNNEKIVRLKTIIQSMLSSETTEQKLGNHTKQTSGKGIKNDISGEWNKNKYLLQQKTSLQKKNLCDKTQGGDSDTEIVQKVYKNKIPVNLKSSNKKTFSGSIKDYFNITKKVDKFPAQEHVQKSSHNIAIKRKWQSSSEEDISYIGSCQNDLKRLKEKAIRNVDSLSHHQIASLNNGG